jgi:phosphoribosylformimino-5-aminoimidazole carboxamide ribotide isomerase
VPFTVIPAIDLWGGRLVSLRGGEPVPVEAFGGNPVAASARFVEDGAEWLHVVDVELAFTGQPVNVELVRRIVGLGARVQASGGLAHAHEVEGMVEAGAERVVLGSAALGDRALVEGLIARHGDTLVVGLEVRDGVVAPRGRLSEMRLPLPETVAWLAGAGAARYLHTGVARVGGLAGPDLAGVAAVARDTGRPVLAAGGVGTLAHVEALLALRPRPEGVVLGRAVLEGALDLRAALALAGVTDS